MKNIVFILFVIVTTVAGVRLFPGAESIFAAFFVVALIFPCMSIMLNLVHLGLSFFGDDNEYFDDPL